MLRWYKQTQPQCFEVLGRVPGDLHAHKEKVLLPYSGLFEQQHLLICFIGTSQGFYQERVSLGTVQRVCFPTGPEDLWSVGGNLVKIGSNLGEVRSNPNVGLKF